MSQIDKSLLKRLYKKEKKSMAEIADQINCSVNKVSYWMKKYDLKRRSVSEAIYVKNNPEGDPFKKKAPSSTKEGILYGIGFGLYWGEGTKSNKYAVRLGNTDPDLIKKFIVFLEKFYDIQRHQFSFGLHIFSDISSKKAIKYWSEYLEVNTNQFYKPTLKKSQSRGNYNKRAKFGVLTLYLNNKKMRNLLIKDLEDLKSS